MNKKPIKESIKVKKKFLVNQKKAQTSLLPTPERETEKIKKINIQLIGIGGGGGNIVSEIAQTTKAKISFIAADTDLKALNKLPKSIKKFHFGQSLLHGLGTGINPEIGKAVAKSEKEEIKKILTGQDLVILVATLGGGVGSGATQIFAQLSKNLGNLTYGIFTFPFLFEGKRKMEIAKRALMEMRRKLNAFSTLPNERIFQIIERNTPLRQAFSTVNKCLAESLQNLVEIIFRPALINIDFADLKTIFEGHGALAYLNSAKIEKNNEQKEIEKVIHSPLYPYSVIGAKGVLLNIAGQKDLSLALVNQISKTISEKVDKEAKIIFGISRAEKKQGTIVTLLATGCSKVLNEIAKNKRKKKLKKKIPPKKEKPQAISSPSGKKKKEEEVSKKESVSKEIEVVVRKNGLQLKKEIEKEEAEILAKERFWETPTFLRKKKPIF